MVSEAVDEMVLYSGTILVQSQSYGVVTMTAKVTSVLARDREEALSFLHTKAVEIYPRNEGFIDHQVDVMEIPQHQLDVIFAQYLRTVVTQMESVLSEGE